MDAFKYKHLTNVAPYYIYAIRNIKDKKIYVGSTRDMFTRMKGHINPLRARTHGNRRLQEAWNRYGEESFESEILNYAETYEEALTKEQEYIDKNKSYDAKHGYNISPTAGCTTGVVRTEEFRKKLSEAHTGKRLSEEHREAISKSMKGLKKTGEHQEKITQSLRNRSPEIYARGDNHYNAKLTENQVKEIIIKAHAGESMDELASKYGVGRGAIEAIKYNRSWKHIDRDEVLKTG